MESHLILVIEDDSEIQNLYEEAFDSFADVQLEFASSGTQAVPMLFERHYSAIIMDLKLPGVNGIQLISHAKENVNRGTPIFIISGYLSDAVIVVAQNLGVVETISKPFDPDYVAKKIHDRVLEGSRPLYYDAKLTRTVMDAISEIFTYYFGVPPVIGTQQINPQKPLSRSIISGVISISGRDFTGTMAISTEGAIIKDMANALFPGLEFNLGMGFAADILGVLCYQVMEKIKASFLGAGREAMISSPAIIVGKDHYVFHKTESPLFFIPLTIKNMNCSIEFYFNMPEKKGGDGEDWLFSTQRDIHD